MGGNIFENIFLKAYVMKELASYFAFGDFPELVRFRDK